ncbi:ricin-type beta-trefoil lectin domain protein [Actinokineospora soli]|uniref:Ricin-type beta-trefoil lectin domain protein n=1 Tax=Actinokineospora soli TaxID=1048753 RepID=A0ABW2TL95_9PSEU
MGTCSTSSKWTKLPTGQLQHSDGRCLTTENDGTANGTKVILATCADTPTQRWSLG